MFGFSSLVKTVPDSGLLVCGAQLIAPAEKKVQFLQKSAFLQSPAKNAAF